MSDLKELFGALDKQYENIYSYYKEEYRTKSIAVAKEVDTIQLTDFPLYTVQPNEGDNNNDIKHLITSLRNKNHNISILKIQKSDTEYGIHQNLYITALQQLIDTNTRVLIIIAGQRPEFGILYNDPQLINSTIQLIKDGGSLDVALLQKATNNTPSDLVNEITNLPNEGKTKIKFVAPYNLDKIHQFIDLSNQVRVILTDNGLKITKRGSCTYFLFKNDNQLIDSKMPKILQDCTQDVDEKVVRCYNNIKEIVQKIINNSPIFELEKLENLPLSIGERQIVKSINELGEEMKGVREEMKDLPRKIAEALSPTFQQIASILTKLESRESNNGK